MDKVEPHYFYQELTWTSKIITLRGAAYDLEIIGALLLYILLLKL